MSDTATPSGGSGTPAGQSGGQTFTQADVDRIVADRVARVEKKYANHAELETEVSRLREQVAGHDALVKRAEKAESERDEIRTQATKDKISRAVVLEAIRAGARNPELVAGLVHGDAVQLEDGQVKGADVAVKKLAETDSYLFGASTPPASDGGARPSTPVKSDPDAQMNTILRRAGGFRG